MNIENRAQAPEYEIELGEIEVGRSAARLRKQIDKALVRRYSSQNVAGRITESYFIYSPAQVNEITLSRSGENGYTIIEHAYIGPDGFEYVYNSEADSGVSHLRDLRRMKNSIQAFQKVRKFIKQFSSDLQKTPQPTPSR